jgi:methionyl-tRNA formyltransferase
MVIKQLENGTLYPRFQIGEVIWAPQRKPEDSKIDFSKNSRYLHNFIRALADPYPNAFAFRNNERVKIKKSIVSNSSGFVLADIGNRRYIISTRDGVILIETDVDLKVGDKLV